MIKLTYDSDVHIRDAARSYLRAPLVVNETVRKEVEAEIKNQLVALASKAVTGRDYKGDYLLLLAARDIYYNLGLKKLDEYQRKIADGKSADSNEVFEPFDAGRKLMNDYKGKANSVALAKNTYGKALAQLRIAMLQQAIKSRSSQSPYKFIEQAQLNNESVLDKSSVTTFRSFIEEVGQNVEFYPWPLHLEQAKSCVKMLTYACLGGDPIRE